MQQHGEAKSHWRAVYFESTIDVPFLMGFYFRTYFNQSQKRGFKLFPGRSRSQASRVSELLKKVLKENKVAVLAMGYNSIEEIGLHSIRKGVTTFLASLPGGPAPAVVGLQAGW